MASWMIHLRVADNLLDRIPGLSAREFVVGNIAPDSGVPNDDWSVFTPSTRVSHFKQGSNRANPGAFAEKYFTPKLQAQYDESQFSFYLGYLVHLMTDVCWVDSIYHPSKFKFADLLAEDPENFIWKLKEDWYDLDYLYLREHPDFRAFYIYEQAVGFENTFMEEFSPDAFDNRRQYITAFYREKNDHLDRDYPYLTKGEADCFVEKTAQHILQKSSYWEDRLGSSCLSPIP